MGLQRVGHDLSDLACTQEYWSQLPFPPPGDPSDPGTEFMSLAWQADSLLSEPPEKHQVNRVS